MVQKDKYLKVLADDEPQKKRKKKEVLKQAEGLTPEELYKETQKLMKKHKVTDEDLENDDPLEAGKRYHEYLKERAGLDEATDEFYLRSMDSKRVDVGLIIARNPIFLTHDPLEKDYNVYKHALLKEYLIDPSQWEKEIHDNSQDTDAWVRGFPTLQKMNMDNFPRPFTNKNGETKYYAHGSKNWEKSDPSIDDPSSL